MGTDRESSVVDNEPLGCFTSLNEEGTVLVAVSKVNWVERLASLLKSETMKMSTEVSFENVSKVA